MNTYKYDTDNYAAAIREYLEANDPGFISCRTSPGITVRTESDKTTLDVVMAAYLAQDNKLLAAQEKMWQLIKAERDKRSEQGFLEPSSGKWFHSDLKSRTQHLGMKEMGASLLPGIMWKTMDGSFIEMTPTIAANIFISEALSDQGIFAVAETHKAAMLLEADPLTYDYSTDWPLRFGE